MKEDEQPGAEGAGAKNPDEISLEDEEAEAAEALESHAAARKIMRQRVPDAVFSGLERSGEKDEDQREDVELSTAAGRVPVSDEKTAAAEAKQRARRQMLEGEKPAEDAEERRGVGYTRSASAEDEEGEEEPGSKRGRFESSRGRGDRDRGRGRGRGRGKSYSGGGKGMSEAFSYD